jgi:hypothetical protein
MSDDRYVDARCGAQKADGSACFRHSSGRYGGRCPQHGKALGLEPASWNARLGKQSRCGSTHTVNGYPCQTMVRRPGLRCSLHSEQALAEAADRRREMLTDKLEQLIQRRHRLEAQVAALRSEINALIPKAARERQLEVRA